MRKVLIAAATAALILGITAAGLPEGSADTPARASYAGDEQDATRDPGWRLEECRYATLNGIRGRQPGEIRKTLACAATYWPVPIETAFAVVACESGFHEHADNSSSSAAGVWQFLDSTWSSTRQRFDSLVQRWELKPSVYNGRANAILGVRKASADGFGAWAGCM